MKHMQSSNKTLLVTSARQPLWVPGLFDIVQTVVPMCRSGKCRTWQIAVPSEQGEGEVSRFDKCLPYSANTNAEMGLKLSWWRHQLETYSASLTLLCGEFTGEFPTQRPMTLSFDDFFDPRVNKWLSKQSWGWWFETSSSSLWRHCGYHSHTIFT